MVVDDAPANLKLLTEMLQAKGYLVLTFPRGAMALAATAKNRRCTYSVDMVWQLTALLTTFEPGIEIRQHTYIDD